MANDTNNPKETGRKRHNISMSEDVRGRAETLAAIEKRSVSNLFEVLVDREYERLAREGRIPRETAKAA